MTSLPEVPDLVAWIVGDAPRLFRDVRRVDFDLRKGHRHSQLGLRPVEVDSRRQDRNQFRVRTMAAQDGPGDALSAGVVKHMFADDALARVDDGRLADLES